MANAGRPAPGRLPGGHQTATGTGGLVGLVWLTLALAVAASSFSSSTPKKAIQTMGTPATFYLRAAPQTSNGNTIIVDEVSLKGVDGYVAIHANGAGAPGPTIGVSNPLKAGVTSHVTIVVIKPLSTSGTVFAVLHPEDNHNTTFDYPHADQAVTLDGRVVVVPIPVTVHA